MNGKQIIKMTKTRKVLSKPHAKQHNLYTHLKTVQKRYALHSSTVEGEEMLMEIFLTISCGLQLLHSQQSM